MVCPINDASENLRQLGHKTRGEVDFSRFLAEYDSLEDDLLAELIEQDGRMRLVRGKAVTLERYIEAVPDLLDRPDPLDAAIDVTLRSISRSSHPDDEAIEKLVERYPQLADSIEEAAALNNALWSTTGLRRKISERNTRTLPQDFGPPISGSENGESRYVLQRLLGSGAFGQVYLAVDRQLSDDGHPALVAVKILASDDRDSPTRHALAEEATKARRIDHPNVVRVLDRGISGRNEDYIVYEYVDGGDLGRWLRIQRSQIPIRQAVHLAAQIARGVQAAHAAGLVHCDLKPGNIMLKAMQGADTDLKAVDSTKHASNSRPSAATAGKKTEEQPAESQRPPGGTGETPDSRTLTLIPKVADFGIAIRSGESLPSLQRDDEQPHPIGNMAYISPEQYRMEDGSLTVPSDVYALGGILFTLLTGELPNGSTIEEIAQSHHPELGRTEPPRLRTLRSEIDTDLEAICHRAMAIKPEDRYSAAGALADDLEAWLRHEPIYWTRPSVGRLGHLWIKRRPTMAASLLIGVLLLAAGTALAGYYAIAARDAAALALQHEQRTEIERLRADQEQLRADQQAELNAVRIRTIERVLDELYERTEYSPTTTEMLSIAWVYHHAFGTSVLDVSSDTPSLDKVRMRIVEKRVDRLAEEGLGHTLESRMWQTNLAFWLIGSGQIDRAEPLLAELRDAWRAMLDPSDTWFDLLDALDASLTVRKHLATRAELIEAADPLAENDPRFAELIQAEQVLIRYEGDLAATDPGNPAHYLVLEAMQELYGPQLLNRQSRYEQVARRFNEVFDREELERRRAARP